MHLFSPELIGQQISDERLKRELSQQELGDLLYMDRSQDSCMESGEGIRDIEKLVFVANGLRFDAKELIFAGIVEHDVD